MRAERQIAGASQPFSLNLTDTLSRSHLAHFCSAVDNLDWIKAHYASLDQLQLMLEMQGLRFMHCTMWTEGVREIVSAEDSEIKFIVSDHPVTLYNASIPPAAAACTYPHDPSIEWIGTQTVFVLNANTCLILTHLEYAQAPGVANLTIPRTNTRYRGSSILRTDAFVRTRKLSRDAVLAINHLLKSRARRFLAASNTDWLFPERSFTGEWRDIAQVLLPKDGLWQFGGEIYVGYKDAQTHYQDAFGRTSGAHEYLRRKTRKADLRPNDLCGCGSGRKFKRCCRTLTFEGRPTGESYGIRERNLMFCHAVQDILGLNAEKTWQDVQREISSDQVKRIHEAFGSLWPEDTDLASLLPRPRTGILRAVYLGMSDPRLISAMILGWLPYFDEVVLAHPFLNPLRIKPKYSPTASPSQHKEQTLKNVLLLLTLEPFIHAGFVHLIPDPGEFDPQFRASTLRLAKERTAGWKPPKELAGWQKIIADDDHRRLMLRKPAASLRRSMREQMPQASEAKIEAVIAYAKSELLICS
jgi:SEC-C motif